MSSINIIPYTGAYRRAVLALTIGAWSPVFARTANEVPKFVYDAFYPHGWATRQEQDVGDLLDSNPEHFWLAVIGGEVAGFLGVVLHPEDNMGEVQIIAVSPDYQQKGIGRQLMLFAEQKILAAGMKMVMVETVGDSGHAPARDLYKSMGFETWPVARYFKELPDA